MKERVKLTVSGLKSDLENGLTRKDLCEKYNLPITQINRAMLSAGLKWAKAKTIGFELVDDTIIPEVIPTVAEVVEAGYSEQQAVEVVSHFQLAD